jgi:hypothetical protein
VVEQEMARIQEAVAFGLATEQVQPTLPITGLARVVVQQFEFTARTLLRTDGLRRPWRICPQQCPLFSGAYMDRAPLTPDETTVLTVTARYPTRGLSAADLAGEAGLDAGLARRTAEGLVAKGLLERTGNLYRHLGPGDASVNNPRVGS